MNIKDYLEQKRIAVDRFLDEVTPPAVTPPTTLHESMRYSLMAGGKRVRPILTIAAAEALGQTPPGLMAVACSLELIPIPEEGPVDGRAVRAILAGIDSTLTDLKRAAEGTPPHLQRALDQLRHDLVKEAIDLTEAAHALAPAETPAIPLPVQAPGASLPKLLSDRRQARTEALVLRRRRRMWVVLVALAAVAAGYHTWRRAVRPGSALPPAMSGAPQGMLQVPETPGGMKVLVSESGKPPRPEEVERFRQQEELKGRVVKDTGGGTIVVMPAGADKGRGQPAAPAPAQRGAP